MCYNLSKVSVLKMISWRNPIIYLLLIFTFFICMYLRDIPERIVYGIVYKSMGEKILNACGILLFVMLFSLNLPEFLKRYDIFIRIIGCILYIIIIFLSLSPMWSYYKYDTEKIEHYLSLTPFRKRAKYLHYRVVYKDIKSIKPVDDESETHYYLYLEKKSFVLPRGTSQKSEALFWITLYDNASHLRDDIDKLFISNAHTIEDMRKIVVTDKVPRFSFNWVSILIVWFLLLEIIFICKQIIRTFL